VATPYIEILSQTYGISADVSAVQTSPVNVQESFDFVDGLEVIATVPPVLDTVTVAEALSVGSSFKVRALSSTRVKVTFSSEMLSNSALTDVSNYTVRKSTGDLVTVLALTLDSGARGLTLTLSAPLDSFAHYAVLVNPLVLTLDNESLTPRTSLFQFIEPVRSARVQAGHFSGEVQGGLLGNPLGLVFFSPALEAPIDGTIIQVDSVEACTKVADTYTMPPQVVDPPVLSTWDTAVTTALNESILWAPREAMAEAHTDVTLLPFETMPATDDSSATATLTEVWDPNYVALLSNTGWGLFDDLAPPARNFMTADIAGPIPAGTTTTITLSP
jgi:hypothetical protein